MELEVGAGESAVIMVTIEASPQAAANASTSGFLLRLRDAAIDVPVGASHRASNDGSGETTVWTNRDQGFLVINPSDCTEGCRETFTWTVQWSASDSSQETLTISAVAEIGYEALNEDLANPPDEADLTIEMTLVEAP